MSHIEHFSPESLDEAAALLLAAGGEARPLPDGTDLIAEVTEGQRRLSMVLDLTRIPELNRLDYDERNGLRIGAAVPFRTMLEFPPVYRLYPMLRDGSVPLGPGEPSDRATLGGHLGHADSAAELAPPLICLRASAAVFGPYGWSELALEALLAGTGRITLQPGEFMVDLRFPAPPPRSSGAYLRERVDTALAGVGVFLVLEPDLLTCCGARLTLCGVGPIPLRALEAERFLAGKRLDDPALEAAGEVTARSLLPPAGSGRDQRGLVRTLTCRAIGEALARARTLTP